MATAAARPVMSGGSESRRPDSRDRVDAAVERVHENATQFARLPVRRKAALLEQMMDRLAPLSARWVDAGAAAKRIEPGTTALAEEWLAGPMITMRNLRLLLNSLRAIERSGRPGLGQGLRVRADGRVAIHAFPCSGLEKLLWAGYGGEVLLQDGITAEAAQARQAGFYQKANPPGSVCAVLGAGNVSAIPPTDVLYKMFVEGEACVLKMNPVNEWLGPILEQALAPIIEPGYLQVVYGGAEVGEHLVNSRGVDSVHITGSANTHDLIVWGSAGPDRDRRQAAGDPLLKKRITSELGNVSPVIVVPARYSQKELWFQAQAVASAVANNASFNCNAAKMLVVSAAWAQREEFMNLVARALGQVPARFPYYPGAQERYDTLLAGHSAVKVSATVRDEDLPWAVVTDLDPADESEPLFSVEPFCGILSETALDAGDPLEFLAAATAFCNERLWGTLSATVLAHPTLQKDALGAAAVERAITELRYGTVGVNVWAAIGYASVVLPWGGYAGATLQDIQSGIGWVHNTLMLEGIDKAVIRGPMVAQLKPVWHYDHSRAPHLAGEMVGFEWRPAVTKLPGLTLKAIRG